MSILGRGVSKSGRLHHRMFARDPVKVLREQSFRLNRIWSRGCYLPTHTISYGAGADAFS